MPILLWAYAVFEVLGPSRKTHTIPLSERYREWGSRASGAFSARIEGIRVSWVEFERKHQDFIDGIASRIRGPVASTMGGVSDWASRAFDKTLDVITMGSDRNKKSIQMYGRESILGSWILFSVLMLILVMFMVWLPIAESDDFRFKKVLQVSNVLLPLSIFILMAFSLNLHTGYTGMVNFGVIFFVSIGAITVGILTAPEDLHGYGWGVLPATIAGVFLAGLFGWALAYPPGRLRRLLRSRNNLAGRDRKGPARWRAPAEGRVDWPGNRYCRLPSAIGGLVVLRVK